MVWVLLIGGLRNLSGGKKAPPGYDTPKKNKNKIKKSRESNEWWRTSRRALRLWPRLLPWSVAAVRWPRAQWAVDAECCYLQTAPGKTLYIICERWFFFPLVLLKPASRRLWAHINPQQTQMSALVTKQIGSQYEGQRPSKPTVFTRNRPMNILK